MIIEVDKTNVADAAKIHSLSWKESHRSFCTTEFVEMHSIQRQEEYICEKIANGSKFFMLCEDEPIGIVSVSENLIEDLYVLPDRQNLGFGTKLLKFAITQCTGVPTLWILENNIGAARLYSRMGFTATGRRNAITNVLDEIEYVMT